MIGFGNNIQNIPETLRALNRIDPELRKRVPEEIKSYAQPMLTEIRGNLPDTMLSGWSSKGRTGYRPRSAKFQTRLRFKGTRPRSAPHDSWPILRVEAKHAAFAIATMAGRASSGKTTSGKNMIAALNRRHGKADRFIWNSVERHSRDIERGIRDSFRRYERIINKELGRRN